MVNILPAPLAIAASDTSASIQNDAVVLGLLLAILGAIFYTASSDWVWFRRFYRFVPMLLMCYFVPSLLTLLGVVNPAESNLYFVVSRYLLPPSLVLLTISVDLRQIVRLGPKSLIMFLTGTAGVVLGGPMVIWLVAQLDPSTVGGAGADATWRGLATVAGSWIGGGANQLAMKEIWLADEFANESLFTTMVAVDVIIAEIWMFFLLLGVGQHRAIDRFLRADSSAIADLQQKMEAYTAKTSRVASATDLMVIAAVGFGVSGLCHFVAGSIAPKIDNFVAAAENPEQYQWMRNFSLHKEFFWIVVLATTIALGLSFTKARQLEGAGASKVGTIFIYILVAVIGMGMDLRALTDSPKLFLVGGIWMLFHVGLMFVVGYLIRAPYFFIAVASKANIGGVASAPVVAAAFHPSLAPVGVLLAVLGYVLGTYGAYVCGVMMQMVAPG